MKSLKNPNPGSTLVVPLILTVTLIMSGTSGSFARKKAAKLPKPTGYTLQFTPTEEGTPESGGPYQVFAVPFPFGEQLDKGMMVVGTTNTSDTPIVFGIGNVKITADKNKPCKILNMSEATAMVEEISHLRIEDIESRGEIMLKRAKGFKKTSSGLDRYAKKGHKTIASGMDFGGQGADVDDAPREKIKVAIEESIKIIEEDREADLARINRQYLRDVTVVPPTVTHQGYFEYDMNKNAPRTVTVEIEVDGVTKSYSFKVKKEKIPSG